MKVSTVMKNVLLMSALAFGCEAADEAFEDEEQSLRSIDELDNAGGCGCECVGCFTDTSLWCEQDDNLVVRVLQSEITRVASDAVLRLSGRVGPTGTSIAVEAFSHDCQELTSECWCKEQFFPLGAPGLQPAVLGQAYPRNLVVIQSDSAKIEPLFLQPGTCSLGTN